MGVFSKYYLFRKFFIFSISFLCLGCTQTMDHYTRFLIRGEVFDAEQKTPLKGVRINFIDTGYDYVRSEKGSSLEIGTSGPRGLVFLNFDYFWGSVNNFWTEKPSRTFELQIVFKGRKSDRLKFKESNLKVLDGKIVV